MRQYGHIIATDCAGPTGARAAHPSCRVVGRANNNANANGGLAYANANNASSNSNTNNGSRLTSRRDTPLDNNIGGNPRGQRVCDGDRRGVQAPAAPPYWEESRNITDAPEGAMLDEIADPANVGAAFDYVVAHLENRRQREAWKPRRAETVARLVRELRSGTFRIGPGDFRTLEVTDGYKRRTVQAPGVYHRVGVSAVTVVLERRTYPTLIENTAASIKGRGMHWLHHRLEADIAADPQGTAFYYKCDIRHYYDSISQRIVREQVRRYTSEPQVLAMVDSFVGLLPQGLSKGLRSSQCLANLHLDALDHEMAAAAPHYYRYCDDIVVTAADKPTLWRLRDRIVARLAALGLEVKPDEAVRPLSEGLDFLGYVTYPTHSLLRKRIKKRFARRIAKVRSRKRRTALVGSFFGMAAHADCRHLLRTLITNKEFKRLRHYRKMKSFADFKLGPATLDGKKNFRGAKVSSAELDRKGIVVLDYERDVVPRREREEYERRRADYARRGLDPDTAEKPKTRYLLSIVHDGRLCKLWSGDRELWHVLDQIDEQGGLPFFAGVVLDYSGQYRKLTLVPPEGLGLAAPADEEVERILEQAKYQRK